MAKLLKKLPAKPLVKAGGPAVIRSEFAGLQPSKLKTFDIPISRLVGHDANPNEQSEKTFDEIVERIRKEGFDEPIIVVPEVKAGKPTQNFLIVSGHHRTKAAKLLGLTSVPAVIREGWDEDRIAIELVSRNQLRGNLNAHKFSELYDKLKKRYDPEVLKSMMGLTEKKAFDQLYKQVSSQLNPAQKKKLEEAKEKVNSVEDLSSVLNTIFREHGSEVDHSFLVMSFGGKKHHYIQVDADTHKLVSSLKDRLEADGLNGGEFFKRLLKNTVNTDNVISGMKNGSPSKAPAPASPGAAKPKLRLTRANS